MASSQQALTFCLVIVCLRLCWTACCKHAQEKDPVFQYQFTKIEQFLFQDFKLVTRGSQCPLRLLGTWTLGALERIWKLSSTLSEEPFSHKICLHYMQRKKNLCLELCCCHRTCLVATMTMATYFKRKVVNLIVFDALSKIVKILWAFHFTAGMKCSKVCICHIRFEKEEKKKRLHTVQH